jgi:Protein of unknown function (DUF3383).
MAQGLNVGRLVRVSVNLAPLAAARRGFGTLLVAGDSNVINGSERIRSYVDLESVATDFGTSAPEYLAAQLYFGQSPRPQTLMIGRWIRTATAGLLQGGILTSAEQALANWTAITNGSFKVSIDSVEKTVTGLNFSAVTNLNGVASAINAVLTGGTIAWDGSRFTITSSTTGVTSTVGYATAASSGTTISGLLKLTSAAALAPVAGFAAETPVECAAAMANQSGQWYGLSFAASTMPTAEQIVEVAAFIEGASISRIFGVTETDTRVLDATYTSDLASQLKALSYKRTCVQFSANPYAICSLIGRAFSVNFSANRSTITLMYKQEPGVVAALLTETQAQTLKAKRCNVFVQYMNDTAIIQYGVMSGQAYFDEIHGLDWFSDALQTAEYNLLYQSKTKIPQTDAGQNQLVNVASGVCAEAINNGLIAPGQWNADGFGQLSRGDYLAEGFYIYTQPMAAQDQSIREQRIAPPIQIALKLAGAIHEIDCIVDVNR